MPRIPADPNAIPSTAPSFSFPIDGSLTRITRPHIGDPIDTVPAKIFSYKIPLNGSLNLPIVISNCQSVTYTPDQAPISISSQDCNHVTLQAANTLRNSDNGGADTNIAMTIHGTDGSTQMFNFRSTALVEKSTISNLVVLDSQNNNQPISPSQMQQGHVYQLIFANSDTPGSFGMPQINWWGTRVGFVINNVCTPQSPMNFSNPTSTNVFVNFYGNQLGNGAFCTYNTPDKNGIGGGPSTNVWPFTLVSGAHPGPTLNSAIQSGSTGSLHPVFSKSLIGLKRNAHN